MTRCSMSNERAFRGRRVTVDGELILAYAEKSGHEPLEVGRMFGARLAVERDTCKMSWKTKTLGWECSACGRVTRGHKDAKYKYCPQCGAVCVE